MLVLYGVIQKRNLAILLFYIDMTEQKAVNTPKCIGVIMDGNRRWARKKNLPTLEGHRKGYKTFRDFISWADEAGIQQVIVYAFSTENWNRAKEEVA